MKSIRLNLFTFFLVLVCISCQTNEGNDTNSSIQSPSYEPKPLTATFTAMGLENKYGCTSLFLSPAEKTNCGTHRYEVTMTLQPSDETCFFRDENGEDIGQTMTATGEFTFTFTEDGMVANNSYILILEKVGYNTYSIERDMEDAGIVTSTVHLSLDGFTTSNIGTRCPFNEEALIVK